MAALVLEADTIVLVEVERGRRAAIDIERAAVQRLFGSGLRDGRARNDRAVANEHRNLIDAGLFYRYRTKSFDGTFDVVACQMN